MKPVVIPALTIALMLVGGCSSKSDEASSSDSSLETSADAGESMAPPSISPTAAPGVAFKYSYAYQLADDRIGDVEEVHSARCEALGVARCRITGFRYSLGDDDSVTASLDLKLAPEIARAFGKDATADVVKADGRLFRTEFEGEDTQPATKAAEQDKTDATARIAELEKQIADRRTADRERAELRQQLADLRDRVASSAATVTEQQARLASTPMSFTYYGRGGVPGFGHENPVTSAFQMFVSSALTMIGLLLRIVGVALPWLLLLLLLVAIARTAIVRRGWRWLKPKDQDEG